MTANLTDLENLATTAAETAAQARRDLAEQTDRQSAERAERERQWRVAYCEQFDRAPLRQAVYDARDALNVELQQDPLGKALIDYLEAVHAEYNAITFAANTAAMAGLDPRKVAGFDPTVDPTPPKRDAAGVWSGDIAGLLLRSVEAIAKQRVAQAAAARQQALDAAATDTGRLTATAAPPAPLVKCGACQRPVDAHQLYETVDGRTFHDTDPCRPTLTAAEAAYDPTLR